MYVSFYDLWVLAREPQMLSVRSAIALASFLIEHSQSSLSASLLALSKSTISPLLFAITFLDLRIAWLCLFVFVFVCLSVYLSQSMCRRSWEGQIKDKVLSLNVYN